MDISSVPIAVVSDENSAAPSPSTVSPEQQEQVARLINGAHAENTSATYNVGWRSWLRFCERFGHTSLPAAPEAYAAWLADLDLKGLTANTIATYAQGVLDNHRAAGCAGALAGSEGVKRTLQGIRRAARGYTERKARALSVAELARLCGAAGDTLVGVRDRAWWLLATSTGLRYSDSAVLSREHVRFVEGRGAVVTVPWSKTDQTGDGVELPIAGLLPEYAALDPVLSLRALLEALPDDGGPLFRGVFKGSTGWREGAVSCQGLNTAITSLAERAGVSTERLTTHSARATFATGAYAAGVSEHAISLAGRWASLTIQRGYRRISDAERFNDEVLASDWTQRLMRSGAGAGA